MDGKDFKHELENPKNIYILISIDSEIIDLYVNRFKKAINAEEINFGSIRTGGKLFNKKVLNVLYMPKIDINIFNRTEFIFIYTDSIDKRSSVYKQNKDRIIEINNDYTKYITDHSNLSQSEAKLFASRCNNDLGIIKNNLSIYNLSDYKYNRFTIYSSDLFGWVDAFIKKQKLPKITESPISIMALLSTNCQNLLKIKTNKIKDMNPYIIKCLRNLESYRTIEELSNIISDCFYLDCQIKKGLFNVEDTLKYLIIKYI